MKAANRPLDVSEVSWILEAKIRGGFKADEVIAITAPSTEGKTAFGENPTVKKSEPWPWPKSPEPVKKTRKAVKK